MSRLLTICELHAGQEYPNENGWITRPSILTHSWSSLSTQSLPSTFEKITPYLPWGW